MKFNNDYLQQDTERLEEEIEKQDRHSVDELYDFAKGIRDSGRAVCEGPCDSCGIETKSYDDNEHLCNNCSEGYHSTGYQKPKTYVELKKCNVCQINKSEDNFKVKYVNNTTIGKLYYHYSNCKSCENKKKCIKCNQIKDNSKFKEFKGKFGNFFAKDCNDCYRKSLVPTACKQPSKRLF